MMLRSSTHFINRSVDVDFCISFLGFPNQVINVPSANPPPIDAAAEEAATVLPSLQGTWWWQLEN